jgi:hypothetical protein
MPLRYQILLNGNMKIINVGWTKVQLEEGKESERLTYRLIH